MDEIRLLDVDGDFLVLEAQEGQKFRLRVNDAVRSSIKGEKPRQSDSITITPREIQDEIRNGTTIADLVAASGATFEFIEKFATPVIAELNHIVSSALSVRLTIAGDRYNDSSQIEFGKIITDRLVTSGASGISWSAKKIDLNDWHVIASYTLNGVTGSATWSFDPRKLTLSPESESALTLSSQETINNSVIPKLRTVADISAIETPAAEPALAETVAMEDVVPIVRGAEFETPIAIEPEFETLAPIASAAFINPLRVEPPIEEPEQLSATADLLEALRRKRTEREESKVISGNLESHPNTSNLRIIDIAPVPAPVSAGAHEAETNTQAVSEPEEEPKPSVPKKGRATMPSWDEIVFGTKTED